MMVIEGKLRDKFGKYNARKYRDDKYTLGTIYNKGKDIQFIYSGVTLLKKNENVTIKIENDTYQGVTQSITRNPLKRYIESVEFVVI